MAKKSDNIQGNPWHDEGNGQFTSQNSAGTKNDNEEKQAMSLMGLSNNGGGKTSKVVAGGSAGPVPPKRKISKDQDMDYIKEAIKQRIRTKEYDAKGLPYGRDLKECEQIGSNLLGAGIVAYSDTLDINLANQLNQALFDVKNDFPKLMESLVRFGTGAATTEEVEKIRKDANERFFELAKSLNIQSDDTKKWVQNFIGEVLGESYLSRARSLLGATERGKGGTLGYYSPSDAEIGEEAKALGEKRKAIREQLGLSRLGSEREISYYSVAGLSTIQINPSYFDKDNFRSGELYEGGGFHYENAKGSAYMTGSHELGHFVDIMLSGNFMNVDELKQRHELFEKIRSNPNVSGYAQYNYLETAAEAFGDVYSNGANALPENIEYVKFMKDIYKKYLENTGLVPVEDKNNGV